MTALDWMTREQLVEYLEALNRALERNNAVALTTAAETVGMTDEGLRDACTGTANHLGHVIRGVG